MLPESWIIEVWYGDQMIAAIYGADGPGVRIISNHPPNDPVFELERGRNTPNVIDLTFQIPLN